MNEAQKIQLLKCLADKSRLMILKSLCKEDMYVERLAERVELSAATVSFHLKKLEEIGAVTSRREQYYTVYSLCPDMLSFRMIDFILEGSDELNLQDERDEAYRQKVIKNFMVNGKLKNIPAQYKKMLIILEELVKAFEPGRTYTEREVNITLADFHDDFCTLRREMVDAGLLARENGIYSKIVKD
jgi:DNA-binding HxlR family transcriptional regulator